MRATLESMTLTRKGNSESAADGWTIFFPCCFVIPLVGYNSHAPWKYGKRNLRTLFFSGIGWYADKKLIVKRRVSKIAFDGNYYSVAHVYDEYRVTLPVRFFSSNIAILTVAVIGSLFSYTAYAVY